MRRFSPIIRVTCIIMCFVLVTSVFASCQKEIEEVVATTKASTTVTTSENTTVETSTQQEESTSEEKSTVSTTAPPKTYKDEVDKSFPYTLCSYTTNYKTSQKGRSTNLLVASKSINNLVLPKGAVFSFNGTVGKRTKARGFKEAIVFNNGKEERGLGGGVCQVSSTVFQTALRSNMKIVERHCHSLKVGYVPLGGDATVYYGSQDFKFRNDFDCNIKIKMYCSGGKLTCKILADKNIDFGNIKIRITGSGKSRLLVRYCNGVENYRTKSYYRNGSGSSNININNKPTEGATTTTTTKVTTTRPSTTKPTTKPSTTKPSTTKPSTTKPSTTEASTQPDSTTETAPAPIDPPVNPDNSGTNNNGQ